MVQRLNSISYLKRINLENENQREKQTNQKWPSSKLCKKRLIFFKLAERADGFTLKRVILFEFVDFKNV